MFNDRWKTGNLFAIAIHEAIVAQKLHALPLLESFVLHDKEIIKKLYIFEEIPMNCIKFKNNYMQLCKRNKCAYIHVYSFLKVLVYMYSQKSNLLYLCCIYVNWLDLII